MVLHVMNTDSSGGLRPLAEAVDVRGASSWSPDGKWIVIGGADADGPGLFKVEVDVPGGSAVRLADGDALNPVWSPRGDLIVYAGPQVNAVSALRTVDPEGKPVELPTIEVARYGVRYRFLPDGSGLVYMQGLDYSQEFHLLDLSTRESRPLTDLEGTATMRTFDITPDGKTIVFDRESPNADIVLIELPDDRHG
jgi:Tol biopolymer transport system component